MTSTECPHCPSKFKDWREYAQHILDKHADDTMRARWAREALSPTTEPEPEPRGLLRKLGFRGKSSNRTPKKPKFRGKPLDRITPSRRDTLPKHVQELYDKQAGVKATEMNISFVEAKTLPEAWFLCVRECMDKGYEYVIDKGSFEGQKRKEFDFVVVKVEYPGIMPLVPDVPLGVPPPTTMEYVDEYLPYLMTSVKKENEIYVYGEDIEFQLAKVLEMYKERGHEINQACMSVGDKHSIFLEHSQCLRLIDTRVRYGKLHFVVYFRSWDLWGGFPANLAAIQILKKYMADEIGVEDGELIACSKGLHLYDHCWEFANTVLGR